MPHVRWLPDVGFWRRTRWLLGLVCVLAVGVLLWSVLSGRAWLITDMSELLPFDSQQSVSQRQAQKQLEQQLNQQIVVLVGAVSADEAKTGAQRIAQQWQKSGLFNTVTLSVNPDWPQWQQWARQLQLALLPTQQVTLLQTAPKHYFDQRAQDLANPFAAPSILPASDDWLGFGRFILPKLQPLNSKMQWDASSGLLYTQAQGRYWVMLVARLPQQAGLVGIPDGLLPLLQSTEQAAGQHHLQLRMAGGALFAAEAKAQAQFESTWMSVAGVVLTFMLLLYLFRSWRALWVFMPVIIGWLAGLAACIGVFGHVHILTMVMGTSLVGILMDFPLHWLVPSIVNRREPMSQNLHHLWPIFAVGFVVTSVGYVLLMVAPLAILRQTAVFSVAALGMALWATLAWLPMVIQRPSWPINQPLVRMIQKMAQGIRQFQLRWHRPWLWVPVVVVLVLGCWHGQWKDDVRTWAHLSPHWLAQAQSVGQISGVMPSAQFLLLEAPTEAALWEVDQQMTMQLATLPVDVLSGYQSLSQWTLSEAQQQQLQRQLKILSAQPQTWPAMRALGVPDEVMQASLRAAAALPEVSLSQSVHNGLAQNSQSLYLGEVVPHHYVSLIRLNGVQDGKAIQVLTQKVPGVHWEDKLARLNQLFEQTRNQTLWLKLVSFAVAWVLLLGWLGKRLATRVIVMPLLAASATVALLSWAGIPIGLFVMFGLLLVSAIGVDYALCVATVAPEQVTERLASVMVAAVTTLISFGLLGLSSTPVVAAFGQTVALGVILNLLLALCLLPQYPGQPATRLPERKIINE